MFRRKWHHIGAVARLRTPAGVHGRPAAAAGARRTCRAGGHRAAARAVSRGIPAGRAPAELQRQQLAELGPIDLPMGHRLIQPAEQERARQVRRHRRLLRHRQPVALHYPPRPGLALGDQQPARLRRTRRRLRQLPERPVRVHRARSPDPVQSLHRQRRPVLGPNVRPLPGKLQITPRHGVLGASTATGAPIVQWSMNTSTDQQWYLS